MTTIDQELRSAEHLIETHRPLLDKAVEAIRSRRYFSAFPEMPSPNIYGETANDDGKKAFENFLNRDFVLDQPGTLGRTGNERSPFGFELGIKYPKIDLGALFAAVNTAGHGWRNAGADVWTGVSLEILTRLNKRSFEIAYAVMHTTGQAFMMAFQAGGPHAQDRALEAIAYAWTEMKEVPAVVYWEKPQGKNEPLRMEKHYRIVPRGIGLVIGCCTFPTWNGYPGLFASLATGNAVIVKPHPGAVLPLAITVQVAREVLTEAGFDPNLVTLVGHEEHDDTARQLALRPEVRIIDFTGSPANGTWLEHNAHQAEVFTEKAGVNSIVIDSTNDLNGMARNIALSLSLYSGQMCTAPQNIYVPKDGIGTPEGRLSFDQVATALGDAVKKLVSDPRRAVEILGAIQNDGVWNRVDEARSLGEVLVDSTPLPHPQFEGARIRTPLIIKLSARQAERASVEIFGPVSFIIATQHTNESIELAKKSAIEHGAITMSVYSTSEQILEDAQHAAGEAGVALSCNLTGGVLVNQNAAFSDYHATGANPAANSCLTDSAFVAKRFRIVQTRRHVAGPAT